MLISFLRAGMLAVGVISIVSGLLIIVRPKLLTYFVSAYLIIVGMVAVTGVLVAVR